MYDNSWTKLISIRGSKRTNNKEKGRLRLSLKGERISSRITTTITSPGETLLGNWDLPLLKWLTQCSENQYTKSWRKLRTSHSLSGQTRWGVDPMKHNQSIHCQYHQDQRHTTEDYRTLRSHLEQLVREERLKQFLHQPNG